MMRTLEWESLREALGQRVMANELLSRHTTFRIGGPADLFVRVDNRDELVHFVMQAYSHSVPVFVLGNGSNVLVSDAGVRGLVIENHSDGFETREDRNLLFVLSESGSSLPGLGNRLARLGWSGLEWAIGVPSTIGAAIVGNAGAHGGCVADNLMRAEVLTENGGVEWWPNEHLDFSYRSSRLKQPGSGAIVLRGEFRLRRDEPEACIARMSRYSEHRRRTQPTEPSVGSMFKNPQGDYAGRLIDAAGLKGTRIGQIEVSIVHGNFFVNHGGGTSREVQQLIELVRNRVAELYGVELELEIQMVGDWL